MIIAATGHRPDKLGGYGEAVFNRLVKGAVLYLEEERPSKVISGMAQGWDTAWAVAAWHLKIPFIAAVPFASQAAIWPELGQRRWSALLKEAAEVVIVCKGEFAAWKLHKRNYWMVDHCDKLCALWNGSPGGTASCVAYAQRKGKPIDNLWDEFVAVRGAA